MTHLLNPDAPLPEPIDVELKHGAGCVMPCSTCLADDLAAKARAVLALELTDLGAWLEQQFIAGRWSPNTKAAKAVEDIRAELATRAKAVRRG